MSIQTEEPNIVNNNEEIASVPDEKPLFEPTQNAIKMMQRQVIISDEEARNLLIRFKGNMFNAVSYAMGDDDITENDDDKEEVINIADNHIDPKHRINQFRDILDKKDKIFTEYTKKEYETNMDTLYDISYIAFAPNTQKYSKETKKMTLKSFMEFVAKPFIEGGDIENINPITFEQIQEDPNLLGPKPIKEDDLENLENHDNNKNNPTEELTKSNDPNIKIDVNINDENDENDENNENNENNENLNKEPNIKQTIQKINKPEIADKGREAIKKQLSKYFDEKLIIKKLQGKADKMVRKWRCQDSGIIYRDSQIKNANILGALESKLEAQTMNLLATKILMHASVLKKGQYYVGNVIVVDKWFQYSDDDPNVNEV